VSHTLSMPLAEQLNVHVTGNGERTLLLAHGYCCDQRVFDRQVEVFSREYRVVTYDIAGFGASHPDAWDAARHATLEGHAQDMLRLIDELALTRITLVGASMSAMTGLMASLARPECFEALVFVAGSPRYLNDVDGYVGGFDRDALDGFYALVGGRVHWSGAVTGLLLNGAGSTSLLDVTAAVERVRPDIALTTARVIFESDCRDLLPRAAHPVLIVQTRADAAVPTEVGEYMARAVPHAELVFLGGVGHLPMRTESDAFNAVLGAFLDRTGTRA